MIPTTGQGAGFSACDHSIGLASIALKVTVSEEHHPQLGPNWSTNFLRRCANEAARLPRRDCALAGTHGMTRARIPSNGRPGTWFVARIRDRPRLDRNLPKVFEDLDNT